MGQNPKSHTRNNAKSEPRKHQHLAHTGMTETENPEYFTAKILSLPPDCVDVKNGDEWILGNNNELLRTGLGKADQTGPGRIWVGLVLWTFIIRTQLGLQATSTFHVPLDTRCCVFESFIVTLTIEDPNPCHPGFGQQPRSYSSNSAATSRLSWRTRTMAIESSSST
jgi:hypothetical protein